MDEPGQVSPKRALADKNNGVSSISQPAVLRTYVGPLGPLAGSLMMRSILTQKLTHPYRTTTPNPPAPERLRGP